MKRVKGLTKVVAGFLTLLLWSLAARADVLNFTLTTPNQTGSPGETLVFSGTISNPTAGTVFLNGENLSTSPSSFLAGDASAFFSNTPLSLTANGAPGDTTGDVDLFSITIGASAAPGTYTMNNFFDVIGGSTSSSSGLLATQPFSITVNSSSSVPEPGTMTLFATGMAGWTARKLRRLFANRRVLQRSQRACF